MKNILIVTLLVNMVCFYGCNQTSRRTLTEDEEVTRIEDLGDSEQQDIVVKETTYSGAEKSHSDLNKNSSKPGVENISEKEDTLIYYFSDQKKIHNTPYFENYTEYCRDNNKYKNWDKNDKRETIVGFVVEKDGTTSYVKVIKSSGIEMLDNEAIRLAKQMKHSKPGTDLKGNPIRVGDMTVKVFFPSK
jgi:TonB family protein